MEETKESHATASPLVDEIPDIERCVTQPQPADFHRPLARELYARFREMDDEILGVVYRVPQLSQPGPCLVGVEAARNALKIGFE